MACRRAGLRPSAAPSGTPARFKLRGVGRSPDWVDDVLSDVPDGGLTALGSVRAGSLRAFRGRTSVGLDQVPPVRVELAAAPDGTSPGEAHVVVELSYAELLRGQLRDPVLHGVRS